MSCAWYILFVSLALSQLTDFELSALKISKTFKMAEALQKEVDRLTGELTAQKQVLLQQQELHRQEREIQSEMKTVYVTKESKKIPKLKGTPTSEEDVDVEEWLDDIQRYIKARKLPDKEAFSFIMEHLDGAAKWEVRFRFTEDPNPEEVLRAISQVFGVPDSMSRLQEQFFKRNQSETEGILEYSLALMRLLDKIEKRDSSTTSQHDKFLKGKFTEGVREESLRRELRGINIEKPDLAFWELRDRAIKWLGEDTSKTSGPKKRVAVGATVQETKVKSEVTTEGLLEIVKKQQEQIEMLSKLVQSKPTQNKNQIKDNKQDNSSQHGQPSSQAKTYKNGKERACFRCQQTDHIVKDCPYPPAGDQSYNASAGNQGFKGQDGNKNVNNFNRNWNSPVPYQRPPFQYSQPFPQQQPNQHSTRGPVPGVHPSQFANSALPMSGNQGNGNLL